MSCSREGPWVVESSIRGGEGMDRRRREVAKGAEASGVVVMPAPPYPVGSLEIGADMVYFYAKGGAGVAARWAEGGM